jgi:hypothetical protein
MRRLALYLAAFAVLVAVSAAAKAFMDTRVFQSASVAFASCPDWLRDWMRSRSSVPIIKITDGWHAMQMVMFAAYGAAFFLAGRSITLFESELWAHPRWWRTMLLFVALAAVRALVHGLVFESIYPIM